MIDIMKVGAFTTIELGRVGENEFRPQQIDISAWLTAWPGAAVSAVFSRPDGQLYTVVTDVTTSPLTWTPGTADLAVTGDGKLELRIITADGVVGKSAIIRTVTHGSLGATGEPPTPPAPDWTETVAENATEARTAATDAQQAAQAANDTKQAIDTAEPARVEAEQERATAESERASAESDRATAESNRSTAESGRQTAENNRATAEQNRAAAETNRANAESTRGTAETNRVNAETIRQNSESTRQTNESTRQFNESARGTAEGNRSTAESNRVTAENNRSTAESNRAAAENARNVYEAYSAVKAYAVGNKVIYNGSSYLCIKATTAGILPTDTSYWTLIASGGTGTSVITGYSKAGSKTALATTDTVNQALGKLEAGVDANGASISELSTLTANYNKRLSSIDPFAIFGASWDKSSNPTLTKTDVTNVFVSNVGVDGNVVVNDFDKALIWGEMKQVVDSLGNTFIRIPKCYIRKTDTTNLKTWQVSKTKYKGFYLPKCFWDFTNNKELDYVDVGAYNASSADGIKLDSKAGTYPLINKNIVQFRTMAQANGAGYQQLDIHVVDLLQTLFIIEQGTIQSQSKVAGYTNGQYTATHLATATETAVNRIIVDTATAALYEVGQAISVGTSQGGNQIFYGRTITGKTVIDASNTAIEFDGTAVNIATGNMLYNTGAKSGFSAGIAASVGSPVSNSSGKFPFVWHGIENLFGSIYQFVDGVNINERQAWVCPDAASYASNLFTAPYEQLNYVNGTADGYTKEMGYDPARPYASFPTAVGGSSSTYYGDYYYQSTGQRIALLGGLWNSGAFAGLFCWYLRDSSSYASPLIGGRLIKKPL